MSSCPLAKVEPSWPETYKDICLSSLLVKIEPRPLHNLTKADADGSHLQSWNKTTIIELEPPRPESNEGLIISTSNRNRTKIESPADLRCACAFAITTRRRRREVQ